MTETDHRRVVRMLSAPLQDEDPPRKLRVLGREIVLPRSRRARISIGGGLVVAGMFGFLPVLGFWMIPVGLLVLSTDVPAVRRWRRRVTVYYYVRYSERFRNRRRGSPDSGGQ